MRRHVTIALPCCLLALGIVQGQQKQPRARQRSIDELSQAVRNGDVQALEQLRALAGKGDAIAEFNLGVIYQGGEGVPKDAEVAARWYRKAAEQGDASAQKRLDRLTESSEVELSESFEVALRKERGIFIVPVLINDKISLDFILDSGASDVSIPADVVLTLMRTGTLTAADFRGTNTYVLADGSTVPSKTFRIKSLKVGNRVLENVSGSLSPVEGSLLLGQSFLSRFKSWSVDNLRQVLTLR
jgi:predicted aspartyl protease